MNEAIFYTDSSVRITDKRAVIENTTYVMANVSSVSTFTVPRSMLPLILGPLIIVCALLLGGDARIVMLHVGVATLAGYWLLSDTYYVRIGTNGGEHRALKSHNKDYVDKVVDAMNTAILTRHIG